MPEVSYFLITISFSFRRLGHLQMDRRSWRKQVIVFRQSVGSPTFSCVATWERGTGVSGTRWEAGLWPLSATRPSSGSFSLSSSRRVSLSPLRMSTWTRNRNLKSSSIFSTSSSQGFSSSRWYSNGLLSGFGTTSLVLGPFLTRSLSL